MNKPKRKMEISERAKQFGAFAAIKGFEKELRKREEIFEKRAILSDDKNAELDFMLREMNEGNEIIVTHYFKNRYVKTAGVLKGVDKKGKSLLLGASAAGEGAVGEPSFEKAFDDEMSISFSDIKDIEKR